MAAIHSLRILSRLSPAVGRCRTIWRRESQVALQNCFWVHTNSVQLSLSASEALSVDNTTEDSTVQESKHDCQTFAELFRSSKFAKVLNPVGKKVSGTVVAVVDDNIYVDFGCKFHAVVPLPKEQPERYVKGASVVVVVRDLEMTDHFIGDSRDTSLLEAEAELVLPKHNT